MTRLLIALAAAITLSLAAGSGADAQTKKKDPRCVPNFFEACNKRCTSSGGRVHLCPSYCEKKKMEYGCP